MNHNSLSNIERAVDGYKMNHDIGKMLLDLKNQGYVNSFETEPKYAVEGFGYKQFRPDFEIVLPNQEIIVIDNTNTIRHARLKGKQWDAYGTKVHFRQKNQFPLFFVIVPNPDVIGSELRRREENASVIHEKNKIESSVYFSMIDRIFYVDEFIEYLLNPYPISPFPVNLVA